MGIWATLNGGPWGRRLRPSATAITLFIASLSPQTSNAPNGDTANPGRSHDATEGLAIRTGSANNTSPLEETAIVETFVSSVQASASRPTVKSCRERAQWTSPCSRASRCRWVAISGQPGARRFLRIVRREGDGPSFQVERTIRHGDRVVVPHVHRSVAKVHVAGGAVAAGVASMLGAPFPLQIVHTRDTLAILYEAYHQFRIAPIGRDHAEYLVPAWMGHSVARWDGDTLVVDVNAFNGQTWLDRAGNFHSEALHVVERYTRTAPDVISYEATIEDPNEFTRPWT